MDIDIKYHKKTQYLYLTLSGDLQFDKKILEDQTLPEALKIYNCSKVLIDIRKLDVTFDTLEKYSIGTYFAQLSSSPLKVKTAILGKKDFIDAFILTVAKNRGAFFEAFYNKNEAIEWLLQ